MRQRYREVLVNMFHVTHESSDGCLLGHAAELLHQVGTRLVQQAIQLCVSLGVVIPAPVRRRFPNPVGRDRQDLRFMVQ